ncbi:MAG: sugar ABC transporter ATP-binding protein [Deltaproteobacteria bacterium]|nr:sugar ABC transporter ATP-binding protein [Deltaproteobacteria bacterium]
MNNVAVGETEADTAMPTLFPASIETVYRVQGVCKSYSGTPVLTDINLDFIAGEIHGIIGKNGAGKSTLVDIMHGSGIPSKGSLTVFDETVTKLTPTLAHEKKIVLVPQKTNYAKDLTIAESLYIGSYPKRFLGYVDNRKMRLLSKQLLQKIDLQLDPGLKIGDLSLEKQRLLEVVKALWCFDAKILILDETTAALGIRFREKLFKLLKKVVSEERRTVLFIGHRLDEIMDICDRVSVLRDGRLIKTANTSDLDIEGLAELIIGEKGGNGSEKHAEQADFHNSTEATQQSWLKVSNLNYQNAFSDISFDVGIGEIVGIAGMVGSGYSEILRYIGGLLPGQGSGEILLGNQSVKPNDPAFMKKYGLGYLTNKREDEALFHGISITDNLIGSNFKKYISSLGLIQFCRVIKTASSIQQILDIKMPLGNNSLIDNLSGGNKQKVLVGRLLDYDLKVLLMDEVAEGVDIGARRKLLNFIRKTVTKEAAVVMASNVVMDLMDVCDRIVVIYQGNIVKTFNRCNFNENEIYSALQGIGISRNQGNCSVDATGEN